MQLTVTTFLSVDGVYQSPGGHDEDTRDGFDRGGWLVPHFDDAAGHFMGQVFEEADAFLLGRTTFEIFQSYWPHITDPDDPVASRLNTLPKYVVSNTMTESDWADSHFISGDVAGQIAKLKEQEGRELQVHGSGLLVRFLLENDLVDRLNLLVFPVIVGAGRRLFADSAQSTGLALDRTRTTGSGVEISVYRPVGRAELGEIPPAVAQHR
jgi:dihydrofolate reductase